MSQTVRLEASGYDHVLPTAVIHLPKSTLEQDVQGRHVMYFPPDREKLNGSDLEKDSDAEKALTDIARLLVMFNNADADLRATYTRICEENKGFFKIAELRVNMPELRGHVEAVDSLESRIFLAAYLFKQVLAGQLTYAEFDMLVKCVSLRGKLPEEKLNERDRFVN